MKEKKSVNKWRGTYAIISSCKKRNNFNKVAKGKEKHKLTFLDLVNKLRMFILYVLVIQFDELVY